MATDGAAPTALDELLATDEDELQLHPCLFAVARRDKTRNRSRDKRLVEIEYLRQRARDLEFQLQTMTGANKSSAARSPDSMQSSSLRALFDTSWRTIARRQLDKRQQSEEENGRLKRTVMKNVRAVQRLQRLLLQTVMLVGHRQNEVLEIAQASPWTPSDLELTQRFAQEVAVEYSRVDAILESHGVGKYTPSPDQGVFVACVQAVPFNNGPEVLYLDLQSTCMIPFPFRRVRDMAWKAIQTSFGMRCPVDDWVGDDVVAVKLPSSLSGDSVCKWDGTDCLLVMQRYIEKKRMVFVWRTSCDDARQSETMVTDETGWCVLEPMHAPVGAGHLSGTLVRGCVHAIPIARETRVRQQPEEVSALTGKLVEGLAGDMKALKDTVEDLLLTEAMQYAKKMADA